MQKAQKYLEAIKTFDDWVIVSKWAEKVSEMFPEILREADKQAKNQKRETTGLKEIAARISSGLSTGNYPNVEIDETDRPRKVKYITENEKEDRVRLEIASDVEPLTRTQKIESDYKELTELDRYRIEEIENISRQLNSFFSVNFDIDHASALLNPEKPGKHHPDNLQLLIKAHNSKKSNKNWQRFTIDEQIKYIKHVVELQTLIAARLEVNLVDNVLDSLLERLKSVY